MRLVGNKSRSIFGIIDYWIESAQNVTQIKFKFHLQNNLVFIREIYENFMVIFNRQTSRTRKWKIELKHRRLPNNCHPKKNYEKLTWKNASFNVSSHWLHRWTLALISSIFPNLKKKTSRLKQFVAWEVNVREGLEKSQTSVWEKKGISWLNYARHTFLVSHRLFSENIK